MRKLGREYIIVPEGLSKVNFNKMISFNGTAAYLWENLQGKEFDIEDIVRLLTSEYDVDEETARQDSIQLIESWKKEGLASE